MTIVRFSPGAALCAALLAVTVGCEPPRTDYRFNEVYAQITESSVGVEFHPEQRADAAALVDELFGSPDAPLLPDPTAYLLDPLEELADEKDLEFPEDLQDLAEEVEDDPEAQEAREQLEAQRQQLAELAREHFIDPGNLAKAAGPVVTDQQGATVSGLYRRHCVHCHGVTGDGTGPTAAFLNPYPRDFRAGLYKFKSTPRAERPTDEDLRGILLDGIPGTAMPSFRLLKEDEIAALVDYVKYLSVRGEFERKLIELITEVDYEPRQEVALEVASRAEEAAKWLTEEREIKDPQVDQQTIRFEGYGFDRKWNQLKTALDAQGFEVNAVQTKVLKEGDSLYDEFPKEELIEDELGGIAESWVLAELEVTEVPSRPKWTEEQLAEKIEHGRALFYGQGGCRSCHGETQLGDGQTGNYDEWTKPIVKAIEAAQDPQNPEQAEQLREEFLTAGALPPRPIRPRTLRMGVYRGGREPYRIFLRIRNGISGAGMPAASNALSDDDVWALVEYVRQLPREPLSRPAHQPTFQKDRL